MLFCIFQVYHHIKLHTSQTPRVPISTGRLWDHIKLHISQTRRRAGNPAVRFTTICLSNMPLNFLSSFEACLPYKITYFSNNREIKNDANKACLPYKITYFSNCYFLDWCKENACLPYKITYFSNWLIMTLLIFGACLPYKITYFSNCYFVKWCKENACLPYKITHLSNAPYK